MYKNAETHKNEGRRRPGEEVDTSLFWGAVENCEFNREDYGLGFRAHIGGKFKADFTQGFSMNASMENGLNVKRVNGGLNLKGKFDPTFSVGGVGEVDFDEIKPIKLKGYTLQPNNKTWMALQPYYKTDNMFASFNDTGASAASTSASYFDGRLNTRIQSDFGDFNVNFPPNPEGKLGT